MSLINTVVELKSPYPKAATSRKHLPQYQWQIIEEIKLTGLSHHPNRSFLEVLDNRKTRREFRALTKGAIGELFYLANRTISRDKGTSGLVEEHRPVVSSGGLHCVECLVMFPDGKFWYRYDSLRNTLQSIKVPNTESLISECREFFPTASEAAIIWYLGDLQRLKGKYVNPESLMWRDVGAVIATHSLVCEYLNLAYCPIGITGRIDATKLSQNGELIGLGIALVGHHG